jgi:hypothetical protein
MTPIEQAKAALEFIQHLHSCEDEGMASGQPSKEDYLKAREITDDALSALSTIEGSGEPVAVMPNYDAGLLSDYGGGNVEWWQDYIRAELGRSEQFYQDWYQSIHPSLSVDEAVSIKSITLEGEQPDPAGTITVTVQLSDGAEVEAIRTCANSIYHMVTVEGILTERLTKAITRS